MVPQTTVLSIKLRGRERFIRDFLVMSRIFVSLGAMEASIISFPAFTQPKGTLVPVELADLIPFDVKRVYLITGNKDHKRGQHAHVHEQEVFWCVAGSVTLETESENGVVKFEMNNKAEGIFIPTMCWHEFYNFSDDCVVLAFSSTNYMPGDENYLTDRTAFRASLASL